MCRTFKQRIIVLGLLAALYLALNGVARYYAPAIVTYVVKQALIQKAPESMSIILVQERFQTFLASGAPGSKLKKLFALSNYLEKVQKLTPTELDQLLAPEKTAAHESS